MLRVVCMLDGLPLLVSVPDTLDGAGNQFKRKTASSWRRCLVADEEAVAVMIWVGLCLSDTAVDDLRGDE